MAELFLHQQVKKILRVGDHELLEWTRAGGKSGFIELKNPASGKGSKKLYSFEELFYVYMIKLLKIHSMSPSLIMMYLKALKRVPSSDLVKKIPRINFLSPEMRLEEGESWILESWVSIDDDSVYGWCAFCEKHKKTPNLIAPMRAIRGETFKQIKAEAGKDFGLGFFKDREKPDLSVSFNVKKINEDLRREISIVN